ncbi:hypothetical protein [Pontibacter liquoris]|uniref:hypothetical protein n=1 Tax=Pontibacter liquoris TaxID=2905677 RepID=UPI001FA7DAE7|nr:hypothetical protein [Pontibacter liquoris]
MNLSKHILLVLIVGALAVSCSPTRGKKAIVVDDDGRSMRFDNGHRQSRDKSWNSTKSTGKRQKQRDKAFKKRRRN